MKNFIAILLFIFLSKFTYADTDFCRRGLHKVINDNQTIYDTINVMCGGCRVIDLRVKIDTLIHTWIGDLTIKVMHNGITRTLVQNCGGSGDNMIGLIFDDSATQSICNNPELVGGVFRPLESLVPFYTNLPPADGQWILSVNDNAIGDTGYLQSWCVSIDYIWIEKINNLGTSAYEFSLSQNYPNPFNPITTIRFDIPTLEGVRVHDLVEGRVVTLVIYDILGREITTLVNEQLQPGTYEVSWDATNYPSGVYFYRIEAGDYVETRKMILIK